MQSLTDLLTLAIFAVMIVLLFRSFRPSGEKDQTQELKEWMEERLKQQAAEYERLLQMSQDALGKQNYAAVRGVKDAVDGMAGQMAASQAAGQKGQEARFATLERTVESRLRTMELSNEQKLGEMRRTLTEGMDAVRAENAKKLDEIRRTVDEQLQDTLQKRVSDSFKTVSDQLEQVYKGIGEMQTLAADVGGLKQVLSGVKTRGILGEVQLGAILADILAPEQYATNVATIPGSSARVEFAVRLPGAGDEPVWLPIDSKFPGDSYAHLRPMAQLFECRCGGGRLLFSSLGLQDLQQYPEARALLSSIYRYLGSEAFAPRQELDVETVASLVR